MSVEDVRKRLSTARGDATVSGDLIHRIAGWGVGSPPSPNMQKMISVGEELGELLGSSLQRTEDSANLANTARVHADDARKRAKGALKGAQSEEAELVRSSTELLVDAAKDAQKYSGIHRRIQQELAPLHASFMEKLGEIVLEAEKVDAGAALAPDIVWSIAGAIDDFNAKKLQ